MIAVVVLSVELYVLLAAQTPDIKDRLGGSDAKPARGDERNKAVIVTRS